MKNEGKRKPRERQVELPDGFMVTMRPLQSERIIDVLDSFFQVLALQAKDKGLLVMIKEAQSAAMTLIRECMFSSDPDMEIDAADVPFLLNAFLDINMNAATVEQWKTLFPKVTNILPAAKERIKEIQDKLEE